MKKRILSCLMALALCLTLLPTAALAEETEGTEQTPPAVGEAADPANGEAKRENQPVAPEQESQPAEQGEQQEDPAVKQDEAVAAVQAMIDALPDAEKLDGMGDEALEAVTAQLAAIEDAMEDMTDEQLDELEAARYEAAVSALAQLGGGDAPAIMAAASGVTEYKLWVGGVQVTSENKDNIPGLSRGKASYDPDTKTLTLDHARINKTGTQSGVDSAIYCSHMYGNYNNAVVETIELIGENTVTCSSGTSGRFRMIYAECNYITIKGEGSLDVTASDCTEGYPWYSNAISCSGRLTIDHTTVRAYSGNPDAVDRGNFAIDLSYYGGNLILKDAKVTGGVKRKVTNPPVSSSGFKYSELKYYRTLTIVPTEGHEHYICGGQYKCDATHAEESSLTKFTAWSNPNELPMDAGSYYLTENVTLSKAWTPAENVNLCLNGHKITGPDGADVISVPDGIAVAVCDCGGDNAASSEATICHADGASGNGVKVAGGGTFSLYSGKITSNTCGVNNAGTFNMYGGSITGNSNDSGAGGVINSGNIKLYGGTITGNSSAAGIGAVQTQSGSTVTLGGRSNITDNTSGSESTACNLYLADGVLITVDDSRDLFFRGKAGISAYNQETLTDYDKILTISRNALSPNTSPDSYFEADHADYETCRDGNGKLALRKVRTPVTIDYSYSLDYNGAEQTGVREKTGYMLAGDTKATFPGEYTATATLTEGCKWTDNSTDPKMQKWHISKRTAQAADFIVTTTSAAYTGLAQTPTVSLKPALAQNDGYGDLTVEYWSSNGRTYLTADQVKDVGKYNVYVSLTGGDYFNSVSRRYLGTFEITKAAAPAAPNCSFSFDGENAGKLIGATAVMEYSLDGGSSWTDCTADMELAAADITSDNGIKIRVKGTANVNAGEIQTISITEQAAPTAGKTDCTGREAKGSLTGVSTAMEYKLGTDGAWTPITGSTVTGLEGGTYYVRCKASGTKLASPAQELIIAAYQLKTDKDITRFTIKGVDGTINESSQTITVDLPYAVDTDITALAPEITVSALAAVNPASGAAQDFTNPVVYTVTAEDGSTKTYTVTVTVGQLKLTSVTAPENKTLENFCETADAVIATLPGTVAVTTENPGITTLPCAWTCSGIYNKAPGAENTFHWKANTNGCNVNGQTVEGDVTVTNRAAIQLTADAATLTAEKEYDGSNAISGTAAIGSITGIEATDHVAVKADASYDGKAVGARTITVTYSLEGTDAWKYLPPAQQQQAGSIKQRPVTISGLAAAARNYEEGNYHVALTGGTIENLVSGEKVTIDLSGAVGVIADNMVGANKPVTVSGVELSGQDAGNYVLSAQPTGVTADINMADQTPTITDTVRISRGGKTFDLNGLVSGAQGTAAFEISAGGEYAALNGSTLTTKDNVGTVKITVKIGEVDLNSDGKPEYNAYTGTDAITVSVTLKEISTVTAAPTAITGLVYKGSNQALITAGAAMGGTLSYKLNNGTYSKELPIAQDAGDYTVYYKAVGDDDHEDTEERSFTVTIQKAIITIKAKDQSAYVGDKAPALSEDSYTVSGLVGEEKLTTQPMVKYVGADGSEITPDMTKTGEVKILAGGAAASDNYTIHYEDGKLTVSTRPSGGGGSNDSSYTVSVDKTKNGAITVSPKSASKGDTVTVTVKPDKGYELDTLKILDQNGDKVKLTEKNGKYTFVMPAGKVTVKSSFAEEAPEQIFADVPVDAYYYEAVKWAAEKGITGGIGNGLFAPDLNCTRAQIVTFLWRAAGSPEPKGTVSFADVSAGSYYAKAVAWAIENGITGGTGDGLFSPDAACTRAQSAAFLYRAAGSPTVSGSAGFSDVAADAYYAQAVAWAKEHGITDGIGGGLFGSANDCTRAQIAAFLWRLYAEK